MLQRSQMLSLPASGLMMGMLTSVAYTRALGLKQALVAAAVLAVLLGLTTAWVAYRSDCAARHTVATTLVYGLFLAPLAGGLNLAFAQMAGFDEWMIPAWLIGMSTVLMPVLGPAWQTRTRLAAEGLSGPWARKYLDLRAGVLMPGALAAQAETRPAIAPWQVGVLAVNVPLAWRLQGGQDTGLLALVLVLLAPTMVWAGVAQVGPALGKAWFVLDLERRTGQRLHNPQLTDIQAMRRSHWLARWFMRDR